MDELAAAPTQSILPSDTPPLPAGAPLLPARMVNEYVYCPRLAYLEWVQGEWAESADTMEGRQHHRRVDQTKGNPPSATGKSDSGEAEEEDTRIHVHSLDPSSDTLDLAEFEGWRAVPVEYKRGKRPHVAHGAYETECVQLCVQALLLEEHGYGEWQQLSVFQCRQPRVRQLEMVARLQAIISATEDHVLIFDVGPADNVQLRVQSLGKRGFDAVERKPVIV